MQLISVIPIVVIPQTLLLYSSQRPLNNVNLYFADVWRLLANNLLIALSTVSYGNIWIHPCTYYVIVLSTVRDSFTEIRPRTTSIKHCESEVEHRLHEHINENRKLNLYASFKKINKFESYLDYIEDFTVTYTLANLRVSAHNLQTEAGRFIKNKTPRDKRFFPHCKTLNIFLIEGEIHFFLACSLFSEDSQSFLENIHRNFSSTA